MQILQVQRYCHLYNFTKQKASENNMTLESPGTVAYLFISHKIGCKQ